MTSFASCYERTNGGLSEYSYQAGGGKLNTPRKQRRHVITESNNRTMPMNYIVLSHRHRTPPDHPVQQDLGSIADTP